MTMLHAHVTTEARDRYGQYLRGHVAPMMGEELTSDIGDRMFRERVVSLAINANGYGQLNVKADQVTWDEQTDEGYIHTEIEWCEDDCADRPAYQYQWDFSEMGRRY